jgi:SSS family solute:Na+ symporter
VFFLGVFWKRMNWQGCLWAMIAGFGVGLFRMAVDTPISLGLAGFENGYAEGSFLWIVNKTYFQYFSVLVTIISAIVAVAVSLATAQPDYAAIGGLTYATASDADHAETRRGWDWRDLAGSLVVLAAIIGAYLYFRG